MNPSNRQINRERLSSRLGFLMLAAGCAVGLGNVWRFPFIVGQNGGAAFVLVYLAFLVLLGYPLLVCELAIGRAARTGIARALPKLVVAAQPRNGNLRKKAVFWRSLALAVFAGNLVLMMYYTDVCGWLLRYAVDYFSGAAPGAGEAAGRFASVKGSLSAATCWMGVSVAAATLVCAFGVQRGIEKITKFMMLALLALLGVLAVKSLTLPGAAEGLRFYLYPDWTKFMAHPWQSLYDAMAQAFFTLSIGIGCMTIFGSYMSNTRTLATEAAWIIGIDTIVAFMSGLVIFPACATYGVQYAAGPGLIFEALPEVFVQMAHPALWGGVFFLFLSLAALTTVVAVFECLIGGLMDEMRRRRPAVALATGAGVFVLSLPCVLCGDAAMQIEDFLVSNLWLPAGAIALGSFAVYGFGWTWPRFAAEANTGRGIMFGACAKAVMRYVLPPAIALILAAGLALSFAK